MLLGNEFTVEAIRALFTSKRHPLNETLLDERVHVNLASGAQMVSVSVEEKALVIRYRDALAPAGNPKAVDYCPATAKKMRLAAQEESVAQAASIARFLLIHELAHVIETDDADLYKPNLGMTPFEVLEKREVTLSKEKALPHIRAEVRANLILLAFHELPCKFSAARRAALFSTATSRASLAAGMLGCQWAADTKFFTNTRPKTNAEFRDFVNEALDSVEQIDPLVELERKLQLITG